MKKVYIPAIFLVGVLVLIFFLKPFKKDKIMPEISIPNIKNTQQEYTARFEIYTNGVKRVFADSMYHNLSDDAYIQDPDPSIIHIKKQNLTWDGFFKTLPFTLSKDCLVTGTKQTFCKSETKSLKFLLNGNDTPNALDFTIMPNDFLEIRFE